MGAQQQKDEEPAQHINQDNGFLPLRLLERANECSYFHGFSFNDIDQQQSLNGMKNE